MVNPLLVYKAAESADPVTSFQESRARSLGNVLNQQKATANQGQMERENQLRAFMQQRGADVLGGDRGALSELAKIDYGSAAEAQKGAMGTQADKIKIAMAQLDGVGQLANSVMMADPATQPLAYQSAIRKATASGMVDPNDPPPAWEQDGGKTALAWVAQHQKAALTYKDQLDEQQRAFSNKMALESLGMRRQELAQSAEDRKTSRVPVGYRLAGDGKTLEAIPGGPGELKNTSTGFQQENTLRDDYKLQSKTFADIENSYARMDKIPDSPSGDLALLYSYMKMLDPGSVVRESEFATASTARPLVEKMGLSWDRVKGVWEGERMTPTMRADFKNSAALVYQGAAEQQDTRDTEYSKTAESYGLDPTRVVTGVRTRKKTEKAIDIGDPAQMSDEDLLKALGGK